MSTMTTTTTTTNNHVIQLGVETGHQHTTTGCFKTHNINTGVSKKSEKAGAKPGMKPKATTKYEQFYDEEMCEL